MVETPASSSQFIERAPHTVSAWAMLFAPQALPVLQATAIALEDLRSQEDDVDARMLAEVVSADPLMTIKLLAHVGSLRRHREGGDTETVTAALVMLGITPFFRAFPPQESVESRLAERPEALAGFRAVMKRARRAADFALGLAVHRHDQDVAVIHEAALLHDFTEMLLWVHGPVLALEIARRQRLDPSLRSDTVQQELLHIRLSDLQHALMTRWRLPQLLVRITDHHDHRASPQLRNVLLAIRLARHSAQGWDNPAIPDDVRDIAELLHIGPDATLQLLREIDHANIEPMPAR